jgi:hypothetical protein
MTVMVSPDGVILLQSPCVLEDAELLLRRLSDDPDARVDWTGCGCVHTAVIQVLMAARPQIVGCPTDIFIRRHLMSLQ